MKFVSLYLAANSAEAYLIQGLLNRESIEVNLIGEGLSIAAGGLPADVYHIKIMVQEVQYTKASEIVQKYEKSLKNNLQDQSDWECQKCASLNPDSFEICWKCQESRLI